MRAEKFTKGPLSVEDPIDGQLQIVETAKETYEWRFLATIDLEDDETPRTEAEANAQLYATAPKLYDALAALGALPDGYCFCPSDRDAWKPEDQHTGECRAARAALAEAIKGVA